MASLSKFAGRMKELSIRVESNADDALVRVALAADQTIVLATPVDTGNARGNWQASLTVPIVETIKRFDKGGQAAIEANEAVIRARKYPQDIYISNNVHYIGLLNEGYSAQAPANFIQLSVQAAIAALRKIRFIR